MKSSLAALVLFASAQLCSAEVIQSSEYFEILDGIVAYEDAQFSEAISLLEPFAAQNRRLAQFYLGQTYLHPASPHHNCAQGIRYLVGSVDNGWPEAAFSLAELYRTGICLSMDEKAALDWYRKAAESNYAKAFNKIAEIYLDDPSPDYSSALPWLLRAVRSFDEDASFEIGMMYAQGHGVRKDLIQAYKWFHLSYRWSSFLGPKSARALTARDQVREQLMPKQVATAEVEGERMFEALMNQSNKEAIEEVDVLSRNFRKKTFRPTNVAKSRHLP